MRVLNPVHPGSFLRSEIIEAHGLSVTEAARILRVSRPTLSSLLNVKSDLSGEKAFGVDMETLMRMQNSFDTPKLALSQRRFEWSVTSRQPS